MFVTKRSGQIEKINFDKIHKRIDWLVKNPSPLQCVNSAELAQSVIKSLVNYIKTSDIDNYTATLSSSLGSSHSDYLELAGRIVVNNHHKNTLNSFRDKVVILYGRKKNGSPAAMLSAEFNKFVIKNQTELDKYIDYSRDYLIDYFGFKTLERGYLLSIDNKIIERPQDLFMRVAIHIHLPHADSVKKNIDVMASIFSTYDRLSFQYYTHATPTLFNAGSARSQLASCFLLGSEDSIEGIMKTLADSVQISKWSGGIGIHASMWRAKGSPIRGTNGSSNGIIPFLKLFNDGARAFDQGGKRNGSFAIYLEPHHPDILNFLNLKRNHGEENMRCRDLFLALWVSDIFMERVRDDALWSTFCPNMCPGLDTVYGKKYAELYIKYEDEGRAHSVHKARDIWMAIYDSQKESGVPYICYKDTVNERSMQKNIGTIGSSNLCAEIMQYSDTKQIAVCNLASICLPKFVEDTYTEEEIASKSTRHLDHKFPTHPKFNYAELAKVAAELTENLNNIIDKTWYPLPETARSNFQHRPIGIGIQGLADIFMKLRLPFESDEARSVNKKIAEAIYYGALSASTKLCRHYYNDLVTELKEKSEIVISLYPKHITTRFPELGRENTNTVIKNVNDIPYTIGAYPSYNDVGSPLKEGMFHWELYDLKENDLSGLFDWDTLRHHIKKFGVKNSLLVAYMPTATTSQIMGSSSCFEPYVSNIYKRKTLAGQFVIINKYLIHDLTSSGLWNDTLKQYLLMNEGSIQNIEGIPEHMKKIYKTAWEIKQKAVINLAIDRQPFIDQSQSMNLYIEDYTPDIFTSMQFYAWSRKLKTGSYYIRTRPAMHAQKFTIDPAAQARLSEKEYKIFIENIPEVEEETCLLCSS